MPRAYNRIQKEYEQKRALDQLVNLCDLRTNARNAIEGSFKNISVNEYYNTALLTEGASDTSESSGVGMGVGTGVPLRNSKFADDDEAVDLPMIRRRAGAGRSSTSLTTTGGIATNRTVGHNCSAEIIPSSSNLLCSRSGLEPSMDSNFCGSKLKAAHAA